MNTLNHVVLHLKTKGKYKGNMKKSFKTRKHIHKTRKMSMLKHSLDDID